MTCVVKLNGMKVRMFDDPLKAKAWAKKHCRGKVEIVNLKECANPVASRLHYNELMENYGAYRVNPYVSLG